MASLKRAHRLNRNSARVLLDWPMSVCPKLLLFSMVLLIAGQMRNSILPGSKGSPFLVTATEECQDYDLIKPPRFGKREVYLDKYGGSDKCNEKRKDENYSHKQQQLFLNLVSALRKDRSKYEPLMKFFLLNKVVGESVNLDGILDHLALDHRRPSMEPLRAETITRAVVSQAQQSSTKQVNNQNVNLIKKMSPTSVRTRPVDAESLTDGTSRNGYFGIFRESQEYSHGHTFPHFASYLNYLANKSN